MIQIYAKILGLLLMAAGILGYVPALAPNHMLFGLFMVDPMHNILHLVSGFIIAAVGFSNNWELCRKVLLLFATIYALLTVVGFTQPDGALIFGMPMNMSDDVLHLAITVFTLLVALPQRYPTITR